ncbi:MAG: arginase family protein [Desulfobacterales bacterium]
MPKKKNDPQAHGIKVSYPFWGIPTFLRADICNDLNQLDADIAVMGIPFDEGSPFKPGSRFAPRSIREHSMRFGGSGLYDHNSNQTYLEKQLNKKRIADIGDAPVVPTDVAGTFEKISKIAKQLFEKQIFLIAIGGDHSISFPVVRAFKKPIHVIYFDAHLDYSPIADGYMYTNSHAFRHIKKMRHVLSLTQIGLRGLRVARSHIVSSLEDGCKIISIEKFRDIGPRGLMQYLPQNEPCYVSIDIDVYDMSLVPGCVSAEPDGMDFKELRDALSCVAEHCDVVGFDMVEVNPQLDVATGVTSYLAAYTIVEFLGNICNQPRWDKRYP